MLDEQQRSGYSEASCRSTAHSPAKQRAKPQTHHEAWLADSNERHTGPDVARDQVCWASSLDTRANCNTVCTPHPGLPSVEFHNARAFDVTGYCRVLVHFGGRLVAFQQVSQKPPWPAERSLHFCNSNAIARRMLCAVLLAALLAPACARVVLDSHAAATTQLRSGGGAAGIAASVVIRPHTPSTCTAIPAATVLAGLAAAAAGNSDALLASTSRYLRSLLVPKLHAGCSYIKFAGSPDTVPASASASLQRARYTADASTSSSKAPRVALLLMQSSVKHFLHSVDRFSMHLLTHWAYATQQGYDVLLYTHMAAVPESNDQFFFFFMKGPAIHGALTTLSYDYVLYLDWDTYISPLSAPAISALVLQWPGKAAYFQSEDVFNAGVCAHLHMHAHSCASCRITRILLAALSLRESDWHMPCAMLCLTVAIGVRELDGAIACRSDDLAAVPGCARHPGGVVGARAIGQIQSLVPRPDSNEGVLATSQSTRLA